ncbi:hypothetical protein HOU03_gp048 [Caulobacter phage CcrSC]|uniref:Uncharacterized protein n=1 Tax=Caulobacter phage CcrSC TaxID=2283272 RepID=A0A385ED88_9CAUD|nr:hypothetical protein HOU03_gp048 [Caulobacter phage CcrSC]AXQ69630.1 hypothetical protein CcrSC_gp048c [Caulobacter phage CcrSC]
MTRSKFILIACQTVIAGFCLACMLWAARQTLKPPAPSPLAQAQIEWRAAAEAACKVRAQQPGTYLATQMYVLYMHSAARYNRLLLAQWEAGAHPLAYRAAPPLEDACEDLKAPVMS